MRQKFQKKLKNHFFTLFASFSEIPMPQIASLGEASTKVLFSVLSNISSNGLFWPNFKDEVFSKISSNLVWIRVPVDILFDEISTSNYLQIAFIFGVQTL